jgi:hypothetical protein
MAFNPDEYLASKEQDSGFNQDAYLSAKQSGRTYQETTPNHEGMTHFTSRSGGGGLVSPLEEEMRALNPATRAMVGAGSAAAKAYYGGKQLLQGGTLSPESQQQVRDWNTIEREAPAGAIAGNVALAAALPSSTVPRMLASGAGYMALQPTEQQGLEGLQQRGIEAAKGAGLGLLGYSGAKVLGKAFNPSVEVLPKEATDKISKFIPGYESRVATTAAKEGDTADELARVALLKKLPVPITEEDIIRSQITRKYPQQEAERLVAGQPIIGSDLAARLAKGQEKMLQNIDAIAAQTGAKAPTPEAAGETVRSWAQNIYGAAKADTQAAYKYAKELHGDKLYMPEDDIVSTLVENQAMPGYKELFSQAKNMGLITEKADGGFKAGRVTVNTLDKFKVMANQVAQSSDGTARYAGGDIVNKVYNQLDNVAPEFKAAAAMRKRQGQMFEDPTVTQKILGTVEGGFGKTEQQVGGITIPNYRVPSEKLISNITNGSIEDLRYIKNLAETGTPEQAAQGAQAIKEMRGAVIDGMRNTWDTTVTPMAKANQLNKYFDKLGNDKIEILFGKVGANQIADFRKAADILNKTVPSPEGGSQTAGRLMIMGNSIINLLEKIPVAGSGAAKTVTMLRDLGTAKAAKQIPQEVKPISEFRRKTGNKLSDLANYAGMAAVGSNQ